MSDLRISQLPAATALSEGDLTPLTQLGTTPTTRRATLAQLRRTMHDQRSVHVRDFGAVGNGITNDAPAIQAAINALKGAGGGVVQFGPKVYRIASAIVVDGVAVQLQGVGFTEGPGPGDGTWLSVGETGFTPITFTGVGARGSVVRDIAVTQGQSGSFTPSWTPVDYDWFFRIVDCLGGVDFDNVFLCNITRGFYCNNSGRTDFRRIRGQVFACGIEVDLALDVPRLHNIHFWPFWSADNNVMNWQQANGDALVFKRADGPFIDQAFLLGYRSGFRFTAGATGYTTKFYINAAYTDFCKYGVLVDASGVDGLIANFTTQGEIFNGGGPAVAGSNGILVNANDVKIQIGNLRIDAVEDNAIRLMGSNNRLDISAFRAVRYNTRNNGSAAIQVDNGTAGANRVHLGGPPLLEGSFAGILNNTSGNGAVQMRGPGGDIVRPGVAVGQDNTGLAGSTNVLAMVANGTEMLRLTQGASVTIGGVIGSHAVEVTAPAATVNRLAMSGAITAGTPSLAAIGADTNVGLLLQSKGAGTHTLQTGGGTQMQVLNLANAVNSVQVLGGASSTNARVGWQAAGSDANISAVVGQPKGTGGLMAQFPDSTVAGGNVRGARSVDWQTSRTSASQVASGINATLSGGINNTASGQLGTVGGGQFNMASTTNTTVGGGSANTASGAAAVVAGGSNNVMDGANAWCPGGSNASSKAVAGRGAWAAGQIAVVGDAQAGEFLLRRQTTDATIARLTADAAAASTTNTINLPNFGRYVGQLVVVAAAAGSTDSARWTVDLVAARGNGAATVVLSTNSIRTAVAPTDSLGNGSAWRLTIAADTTNGGIAISGTGAAATTINWVARFVCVETTCAS